MVTHPRMTGATEREISFQSPRTREFLDRAERDGVVLDACDDIPKSFLVCDHPYHKQLVYISQLNTQTLQKRTENDQPAVTGGQGKERTHV